ncbi:MAG: hypothetical protein H0W96_06750 [Solirubrobacterales bacterium]|nr:hypothetical protein [Solirubrobacterales bacterium]
MTLGPNGFDPDAEHSELRLLADGLRGLDALQVARLRALTVDAERYRPADIVKMSEARRIATLTAFAITATERGQDDALEQFDRLQASCCCASTRRANASAWPTARPSTRPAAR